MKTTLYSHIVDTNTYIESFLARNSFKDMGNDTHVNKECSVKVLKDCYEIQFVDPTFGEVTTYTDSLNIPQLAGVLSWHNLIDRNYSK